MLGQDDKTTSVGGVAERPWPVPEFEWRAPLTDMETPA